jgi:cytochrome oxidase Cu insertion factor (SCO1/SenC/PrrC family)
MRPQLRLALLALATLLVLGLALAVILGGTPGNSARNPSPSSSSTPAGATSVTGFDGAALPGGIVAPGWTLTDPQDRGRRVALSDYRGQVLVLTFLAPTATGVSPLIAQQIRGALDDLGHPVPAVAISADPALDTPARIRGFLARAALGGRMTYLTGTQAQLRPIWHAYHVVPLSAGRAKFENAATVLLIDGLGDERVLFGVEQLTPRSLAHDIERLQAE